MFRFHLAENTCVFMEIIREVSEEYLLNHVHIQAVLAPEYDQDVYKRQMQYSTGCIGLRIT